MNPFGFLEGPLEDFLVFLNERGNLTFGWAIVVLTVCVRIVLLPLFISQYRSARGMQQIAPQLKALQAKHKNDKRKQQEEMMRLFQEHKVNPFGSCLPIVFQLPIFIALFYVLRDLSKDQAGSGELGFMWIIPDISTEFRSMGWTVVIVALIYGASQLLATEVSMATTPQTNEWQRKLFRFLPIIIVGGLFLYPNIPAGLVLYWLTTNLWTGGQQVVLKRRLGPLQLIEATPEVEEPPPAPKGKASGSTSAKRPKGQSAPAKSNDAGQDTAASENGSGSAAAKRPPAKGRPVSGNAPKRRKPPKKR